MINTNTEMFRELDRSLLCDRQRCPACFSWATHGFSGDAFFGCSNCKTISAVDRRTTAVYDAEYVDSRYNRYSTTRQMSELRISVLHGVLHLYETLSLGHKIQKGRMLDVGYGNGDFIRVALSCEWDAYGYDVNPTEYEGVRRVEMPCHANWPIHYRVITFFDALEHFENLIEARWCSHAADWLLLSFPAVPANFPFDPNWKHNRPHEHHLHFHPKGLEKIFSHNGIKSTLVYHGNPEDSIRTRWDPHIPNINTVALKCTRT